MGEQTGGPICEDALVMPQRSSTRPSSSVVGVRPRRDFAALEERRIEAAALFRSGFGPAEVARQLGVSCTSAYRWREAWLEQGVGGLRPAGLAGCRSSTIGSGGRWNERC